MSSIVKMARHLVAIALIGALAPAAADLPLDCRRDGVEQLTPFIIGHVADDLLNLKLFKACCAVTDDCPALSILSQRSWGDGLSLSPITLARR